MRSARFVSIDPTVLDRVFGGAGAAPKAAADPSAAAAPSGGGADAGGGAGGAGNFMSGLSNISQMIGPIMNIIQSFKKPKSGGPPPDAGAGAPGPSSQPSAAPPSGGPPPQSRHGRHGSYSYSYSYTY
jgi:hypothetical protein